MAVITADGMVGKIQTAAPFSSTVQLLSGFDQFNRISAMISKDDDKNVFGLVEEYNKEDHSLYFRIIEERSEEHTSELQSRGHIVCRVLLEKKNCKQILTN